ncbi:MAG TPA: PQQ-dependent sugar dehydrogenase [Labilithrix sp.]|nr:PQQ-dependent sugar dehydrogenase [Labilithrix sp.]
MCLVEFGTPAIGPDRKPILNPNGTPRIAKAPRPAIACATPISPIVFARPTGVVEHDGKLYVLEQGSSGPVGATVRLLSADTKQATTVIDVSPRVVPGGEAGLLGLAFHPKFAQNHFAYLYYLSPHPQQPPPAGVAFQSVIARYESPDGGSTFDAATEKRILVVDQPFTNHNGGTLAFGNDGFLYFGFGDGGSGGDPFRAAQDKDKLLGKIVRLDVDGGDPYAIPPSNPFAAGGGKPEIYALGFRNPFRFSFDRPTGDLWVGDVGQSTKEEIDKVVLGGNYGWNVREGKGCYDPPTGCATAGLIDPVVDHPRTEASAITGGVVYHGKTLPELTGKYVYGDNTTGSLFAFDPEEASPTPVRLELGLRPPQVHPAQFALDPQGELVFVDYGGGGLYRIAPPLAEAALPAKLSETGCLAGAGLFPYDVNVPQWMDGLLGERFLAVPDGAQLKVKDDARLELPPGSVAVRTLRTQAKPVETQLLVRHGDGTWGAYAYAWDEAGKDATLTIGKGCVACHDASAGMTIGLEAAQLDRRFAYPLRTGEQLATLAHLGMLERAIPEASYSALAPLDGYGTIALRARSYLHANCASCHHGGTAGERDLRYGSAPAPDRLCNVVKTMRATDATRMPPFGSVVPDEPAITVVESWIRSFGTCQ